jgi:hypothetical protein
MISREVLEQVCSHCNSNYCTVREYNICHDGFVSECGRVYEDGKKICPNVLHLIENGDNRVILQLKAIEKLRWLRGQQLNRPVTWDEAIMSWTDEGYAYRFSQFYSSGKRNLSEFFGVDFPQDKNHDSYLRLVLSSLREEMSEVEELAGVCA